MLIKKSDSIKKENSKSCTVSEYNFPSKNISYATALIDGRYPEERRAVNLGSEEIYFVISGYGVIHSEKGNFEIAQGDAYFFAKGEKYWIEGNSLSISIINAPKWTSDQYKIID